MARTRKDFFMLATGIASFIIGFVLIGNFIPNNLLWGGLGALLMILVL